jgi:hypothetical protein
MSVPFPDYAIERNVLLSSSTATPLQLDEYNGSAPFVLSISATHESEYAVSSSSGKIHFYNHSLHSLGDTGGEWRASSERFSADNREIYVF